jgi:aspartate carbamoyltransferase catalytic subunit
VYHPRVLAFGLASPVTSPAPGEHFIDVGDWSRARYESILERARALRSGAPPRRPPPTTGLVHFFAEPSTRTRLSFERAAALLGLRPALLDANGSSLTKRESLSDTGATLEALGHRIVVLRHGRAGAARDLLAGTHGRLGVVSAGEGDRTHPTQALLDLLTVLDHSPRFPDVSVAVFGDVAHSRVARSTLALFALFGVHDVRLAPGPFGARLSANDYPGARRLEADEAARDADILLALRLQQERWETPPDGLDRYLERHGLDERRLALARPDALVLHPGPLNRGVEISPGVADGPRSRILDQVANGVWVRLAVLESLLS